MADALSRKESIELMTLLFHSVVPNLLDNIVASWDEDQTISKLISELKVDPQAHPKFT
jgi:hypothetical protein